MSALNRLGFSGVTTMKMISSTSKTSINGVTLMYGSAVVLPFFGAPPIDILSFSSYFYVSLSGSDAALVRGARRRIARALLLLIGDESDLVDSQLANFIDDVHNVAILHADTTLDIDDAILLILDVLQHRIDFFRQLFPGHRGFAEVILTIIRYGDYDRRFLDDILIDFRVVETLRQRHRDALLQKRCDHHEDDQQHQHDVDHRRDVDFRLHAAGLASSLH